MFQPLKFYNNNKKKKKTSTSSLNSSKNLSIILGNNKDEGILFVFSLFQTSINKILFYAIIFSFFRFNSIKIIQNYDSNYERRYLDYLLKDFKASTENSDETTPPFYSSYTTENNEDSFSSSSSSNYYHNLYSSMNKIHENNTKNQIKKKDYRLLLSIILNDYLFFCPTIKLSSLLSSYYNNNVYLYDFFLPTRTPGFPKCDGLSCHTSELPYIFYQLDIINKRYSWFQFLENKNQAASSNSSPSYSDTNFSTPDNFSSNIADSIDEKVSYSMANYWINLATYSSPNNPKNINNKKRNNEELIYWPPVHSDDTFKENFINDIDKKHQEKSKKTKNYNFDTFSSISTDSLLKYSSTFSSPSTTLSSYLSPFSSSSSSTSSIINSLHRNSLHNNLPFISSSSSSLINRRNNRIKKLLQQNNKKKKIKNFHIMNFNIQNKVHILQNDCHCEMWDEINYQF